MNLLNTVGSRDFGQACVLEIQRSNCGAINNVATGRKHDRVYDMNTKLALVLWIVNCYVIYCNLFQVNHKLGFSPGTFTSKLALPRDLQHKKRKAIAVARAAKQRRIRLKTGTRTSHIIQIAAVHSTGQFSTYVMPEKKMSLKASEITGVTVVGDSMLVKGQTEVTNGQIRVTKSEKIICAIVSYLLPDI
ncbi:uncharacterized protein LOC127849935 [Dreissena polymorpha]|uniref:uncharacterized protein LOC127849935 n=1 Tax=Dreissena polymorpha TaxID=45954 RepID=UPI00226492D6|nr:uncharacterized protein LOC127849935 [Dreissena polymorpha]